MYLHICTCDRVIMSTAPSHHCLPPHPFCASPLVHHIHLSTSLLVIPRASPSPSPMQWTANPEVTSDATTIQSSSSSFNLDIAAAGAQGLNYILGKTNGYSCCGALGVSNTAGAALCILDYTLYTSQIGVTQVHFHDGIGYKYNFVYICHSHFFTLVTCSLFNFQFRSNLSC